MSIYKISTLVLGIIVVIQTTILSIDLSRNRVAELNEEEFKFLSNTSISSKKSSTTSTKNLSPSDTAYINVKTAIAALDKFKKRQGIFYRVKNRAYGHYFDIRIIDDFRERIDVFNDKVKRGVFTNRSKEDTINGVRLYRSRNDYKYRLVDNGRGVDPDTVFIKYDDIFLIPTYRNKKNLFAIDPDYDKESLALKELFDKVKNDFLGEFHDDFSSYLTDEEPIILNASIPCPNNCDTN